MLVDDGQQLEQLTFYREIWNLCFKGRRATKQDTQNMAALACILGTGCTAGQLSKITVGGYATSEWENFLELPVQDKWKNYPQNWQPVRSEYCEAIGRWVNIRTKSVTKTDPLFVLQGEDESLDGYEITQYLVSFVRRFGFEWKPAIRQLVRSPHREGDVFISFAQEEMHGPITMYDSEMPFDTFQKIKMGNFRELHYLGYIEGHSGTAQMLKREFISLEKGDKGWYEPGKKLVNHINKLAVGGERMARLKKGPQRKGTESTGQEGNTTDVLFRAEGKTRTTRKKKKKKKKASF